MAKLPPVVMEMMLKDQKFLSSLKGAQKDVGKFGKAWEGAKSTIDRVGSAVFSMKGALVAALGGISIKEFVGAAMEQEAAVSRLNQSLKNAGDFSADASADLQAFAAKMQANSTISEDTTLNMLALAKSFGISNTQAKELVNAATDLSAATGDDLETSVRNLGKTYSGLAGKLANNVPILKELTKEQLKSGDAVKIIGERFAGSAAAAADTFGGLLAQVKNNLGDTSEEIGFFITKNDATRDVMREVRDVLADFNGWLSENRDTINEVATTIASFTARELRSLGGTFKAVGGTVERFSGLFKDAKDDVEDSENIYTSHIGILTSVTRGYLLFEQGLLNVMLKMAEFRDETAALQEVASAMFPALRFVRPALDAEDAVDRLTKALESNKQSIKDLETPTDLYDKHLERLKKEHEEGKDPADKFSKSVKGVRDELEKMPKETKVKLKFEAPGIGDLRQNDEKTISNLDPFLQELEANARSEAGPKVKGGADFSDLPSGKAVEDKFAAYGAALASSFGQNLFGGKEGGNKFAGDAVGAGATLLGIPGGDVIGKFMGELAGKTKEEAEQMAKDFALGITEGVKAMAENAPVFIKALAENSGEIVTAILVAIPKIIGALVKEAPAIAEALIMELVNGISFQLETLGPRFAEFGNLIRDGIFNGLNAMFDAVVNFPAAFGEQLPVAMDKFALLLGEKAIGFVDALKTGFADSFANAAKTFVDKLVELGQKVIDAITPDDPLTKAANIDFSDPSTYDPTTFKLASGAMVKGLGTGDSVPALLAPGELVIDRTTGPRLMKFIDQNSGGGDNSTLLAQILAKLSEPTVVETDVKFREDVLGRIMLKLSYANARTVA